MNKPQAAEIIGNTLAQLNLTLAQHQTLQQALQVLSQECESSCKKEK